MIKVSTNEPSIAADKASITSTVTASHSFVNANGTSLADVCISFVWSTHIPKRPRAARCSLKLITCKTPVTDGDITLRMGGPIGLTVPRTTT